MSANIEKRKFPRSSFTADVEVKNGKQTVKGQTINISMQGAYVECNTEPQFEIDSKIEVTILPADKPLLKLDAFVVRKTEDKLALQFELKMLDVETLTRLRAMINY